jgi:hypothetical protein
VPNGAPHSPTSGELRVLEHVMRALPPERLPRVIEAAGPLSAPEEPESFYELVIELVVAGVKSAAATRRDTRPSHRPDRVPHLEPCRAERCGQRGRTRPGALVRHDRLDVRVLHWEFGRRRRRTTIRDAVEVARSRSPAAPSRHGRDTGDDERYWTGRFKRAGVPAPPATSKVSRPGGLVSSPGVCPILARRKRRREQRDGHRRACGGDR